ncbi:MAG: hypothetical protein ACRCWP_16265 [Shewanella sp.]
MEVYINTLDYLKDRYQEEQNRFNHFETKCSKMLTFLTGAIGALTAYGGYTKEALFKLDSPMDYIKFLLFILSVFCALCAWGYSLLAIKIGDSPILPKSKEAADYINQSDESERVEYIFNCYVDTLQALSKAIDEKSVNLTHAYEELTISAWGLVLLGVITITIEITK